ncbi:hypothetical protein [Nitrospirillum iridis]|uniref:Lipoprotein n=1 Tax=Nitrospirillum iridis TaxID=765888 RepID=A0A7X0AX22_9PROT|nr:hypothetical protein [Nitrospirillum iridis]MBB6251707.1 hypothetical protein [Nitrospirillum iridis]
MPKRIAFWMRWALAMGGMACGAAGCSPSKPGPMVRAEPQVLLAAHDDVLVRPQDVIPEDAQFQDTARHISNLRSGKEKPACIGAPVTLCIATLASHLVIQMRSRAWKDGGTFLGDFKADMNGNRLEALSVDISTSYAYLSPLGRLQTSDDYWIDLLTTKDGTRKVEEVLIYSISRGGADFIMAKTLDDFHALGIYDVIYPILLDGCPNITEEKFSYFLYNDLFEHIDNSNGSGKNTHNICGLHFEWDTYVKKIPRDERTSRNTKYIDNTYFYITKSK